MLRDIHFLCYSQALEFDRWSSSSHGVTDPLRQSQDKRRSHELQLPSADDNLVSPGYAEPLCVSVYLTSPNLLTSSCECDICPAAMCYREQVFLGELFLVFYSLISYLV